MAEAGGRVAQPRWWSNGRVAIRYKEDRETGFRMAAIRGDCSGRIGAWERDGCRHSQAAQHTPGGHSGTRSTVLLIGIHSCNMTTESTGHCDPILRESYVKEST